MFSFPSMPGMPQMPFVPFPFAGTAVGGAAPDDASAESDAVEQEGESTTQASLPMMQSVPFAPYPLIGLMQMQLSMQMQMIAQMQQFLSQIQSQGAGAPSGMPSKDGTQLPFNLSIDDLQRLLQLDASPKALETLQRFLDFVFDAYATQQERS